MIPLFSQGKLIERTTSQAVGIGAVEIPIDSAASHFAAGQRAFISEADGSEIEYLGTILSVAPDFISVELATEAAKASAAKVWTPNAVFVWLLVSEGASRRRRESGVEMVRSLGGVGYATRLRDPFVAECVKYDNLTKEQFFGLATWIEQTANDGLEEFSYVDADRAVWRVRLDAPSLEWGRTPRGLIAVEFTLQLLAEADYV